MIKLENVSKVYKGDVIAVRDATVDIGKGEFVFLVGQSGSGKSTFIRLLNREETPEQGTIFVAGKDISTLGSWKVPYLRRNIGYIFQDFKLLPKKTVAENVAFALRSSASLAMSFVSRCRRFLNSLALPRRSTTIRTSSRAVSSNVSRSLAPSSTGR